VEKEVAVTNRVNDVTTITVQPVREQYVSTQLSLTYATNVDVNYIYHANTNAATVAQVGGAIAAPFGFGGIVSTALTGLFGIWAAIRSRRKGQLAAGLAQGVEVASEVLKTTPQGQQADEKLKAWLYQHQLETGIYSQVSKLLETTVDNEDARDVAARLRAELEARSGPAPVKA